MREKKERASQAWEGPQSTNKHDSKCKENDKKGWVEVYKEVLTNPSRCP